MKTFQITVKVANGKGMLGYVQAETRKEAIDRATATKEFINLVADKEVVDFEAVELQLHQLPPKPYPITDEG